MKSIETITVANQKGRRLICRLELSLDQREDDKEPVLGGTLILETTTDFADRMVAEGGCRVQLGPLRDPIIDAPPPTSETKHLPPVTVKEGEEPPPPPPPVATSKKEK